MSEHETVPHDADNVATILADTVELVDEIDLECAEGALKRAQELLKRVSPAGECPACAHRRMIEDVMLGALLKHIKDEGLDAALVGCGGLCVPHFSRALELVRNDRTLNRLVDLQRRTMGALRDELAEFIRKNDYRFRHEGFGVEGNSWLRAIGIICGEPDVR